jgi:hypothetical protein
MIFTTTFLVIFVAQFIVSLVLAAMVCRTHTFKEYMTWASRPVVGVTGIVITLGGLATLPFFGWTAFVALSLGALPGSVLTGRHLWRMARADLG